MKIMCTVCPNHCRLAEGERGICRARENIQGEIVCINYGKVTGLALDPIEKKPLYRFYPGSSILSMGSYGCNMRCCFCQNHEISMHGDDDASWAFVTPQEIADRAAALQSRGNLGVAFTYNEPCIGYEYVRDTARLVHERGMKNVLVTNGYVEEWVEEELLRDIDAMNIDLKGFTQAYYKWLGGELHTVQRFIEKAAKRCHVELTTLMVPGKNDGDELEDMVSWIAGINPEIPLHVTRFFPRWNMAHQDPTPVETVYRAADLARRTLKYVYTGNC